MKKLFTMLLVALLGFSMWSCQYDDKDLWNEIGNIKTELSRLNQEVGTLQTLVDALNQKKTITSVEQTATGCTITFSDGKTAVITNGKDGSNGANGSDGVGTNAPEIGIDLFDGVYYWTIGGSGNWLTDLNGNKISVTSREGGEMPKVSIDTDGYWTVNGVRMEDGDGKEIKAAGKDGDSFFKSITDNDDEVIFVLTNDKTIVIPKTSVQLFGFEKPTGERNYYVVDFGKKMTLNLNTEDIVTANVMNIPNGWSATINLSKKSFTVQAPALSSNVAYSGGIITVVGIDKKGKTLFASVDICASVDYTNAAGTFVLCEGNMSSTNGMVVFYDKSGKEYREVFEQANNGMEVGNVLQDIYMANGKIYLLTQNGNNMNGAGRFVVCDARTMRMEYSDQLDFTTPEGKAAWPQHLVITSPTKGYIQYSESGMEATSGICEITLSSGKVEVKSTISETFGKFTSVGAIKTRMVYSRGKLFVGCGHSVLTINPESNAIENRLTYEGQQVKGIAKGADGNIWFAIAGKFSGNQNSTTSFTSNPRIIGMDHAGTVVHDQEMPASIKLPVATWSPQVGLCASYTQPYIYFVDTNNFSSSTATRYNYSTKTFEVNYINGSETIYGIMGEHPTTKKLWVGKSSYVDSNIYTYNISSSIAVEEKNISYPTQKGASPAGIDFTYRFTSEFINK